jgi:purine-binding chemotaxis protein CheW
MLRETAPPNSLGREVVDALEQLLTFALAGEEYAVALRTIREVVACDRITRVPSLPPFLRGAMNLRGSAVPVVDLASKLGLSEAAITRWTCLLVVEVDVAGEATVLGVLVDEVRRLIERTASEIEPPPPFGTRVHPAYLRGFVRDGAELVLVLDLARILSTEELLLVAENQPTSIPAPPRPEE